jgi:anti-anti-sigma factor
MYLTVAVEDYGDVRCIRLAGELDLSQLPTLRAGLAFGNAAIVEVDLSQLRLMDATGLSALLAARRQGRREGRSVRLVAPRGIVRKLFALTDLEHELDE